MFRVNALEPAETFTSERCSLFKVDIWRTKLNLNLANSQSKKLFTETESTEYYFSAGEFNFNYHTVEGSLRAPIKIQVSLRAPFWNSSEHKLSIT